MASFTLSLVDKVTAPAKAAQSGIAGIMKSLKDVMVNGGDTGPLFAQIGSSLGGLVNSAFPASDAMQKVTAALSALGPEGEAAAVVLQVVVGVVTGLAQVLYDWAAAAVVAAGKRDALIATFDALGSGANAGEAALAATTALAAQLPFTTSKVNEWAKGLMAAGIQGKAMEGGVKAIAAATAIMGESGGSAAMTLIKRFQMMADTGQKVKLDRRILTQLAASGVSATALATALDVPVDKLGSMSLAADKMGEAMQKALVQKGGPALEAMGQTWDTIKAKLDEGIGSLFSGASDAVRPFMAEVKNLFGEFNKGSTAMGVGKGIMTAVLTELFSVATRVVNAIHYGFLYVQIAALQVAIAIAPIVMAFRALMTSSAVILAIKNALSGIIGPLLYVGKVILGIIVVAVALGAAMIAAVGFIVGASLWLQGASQQLGTSIGESLREFASSAYAAASNFVQGLVNGITSGAGMVIDAVTSLASGALNAFKGALGIHSPSAVMMVQGNYVAQGAALGIDAGSEQVQRAAAKMGADVPASLAAGTASSGASKGGATGAAAGATVTFEKGAIQIDGAGKSALEITEEMVALVFERLAASQGLMARAT